MRHERQVALLERLFKVVAHGETEAACRESFVELDRYTSATRFEQERRVLFRRLPILVAHERDLAGRGTFLTHDHAGVPLLLSRDEGGGLHAMLNVCRHRGTRLVREEQGSAKAFVCPYHAWTYDLTGRLEHVPLPRTFRTLHRDSSGLIELPCETRHGLVWVLPTPDTDLDVRAWLGDFDEDLEAFGLAAHVPFRRSTRIGKANWKLVMDAFLEGYHVRSLHQRTLARFFQDGIVTDTSRSHARTVGARKNFSEIANHTREKWDVRAYATIFYNVFPNSVFVLHPDSISQISLFPRAVDEVVFVHTLLIPSEPESEEESERFERTWNLIDEDVFGREDLPVAESIQSVLLANASDGFPLGRLEHLIRFFHDETDRALGG